MSTKRVQLTSKDILEKEFKSALRGYNQEEVDEFLDTIIKDYEIFNQEINKLKAEVERFRKSTEEPRVKTPSTTSHQVNQVNYDVLKRLSNLEKAVFGQKLIDADS